MLCILDKGIEYSDDEQFDIMKLIVDGNSEYAAHTLRKMFFWREKNYYFRSNQMPFTDEITEMAPYLCYYSELPSNISTMTLRV